jgi:hypothetical protein
VSSGTGVVTVNATITNVQLNSNAGLVWCRFYRQATGSGTATATLRKNGGIIARKTIATSNKPFFFVFDEIIFLTNSDFDTIELQNQCNTTNGDVVTINEVQIREAVAVDPFYLVYPNGNVVLNGMQFLQDGVVQGAPSSYSPDHVYEYEYTGDGSDIGFRFADPAGVAIVDGVSSLQDAPLIVRVCGPGMGG